MGDENSMKNRSLRPREANVVFKDAAVRSAEDYRKQYAPQMVTLNIRAGEKRLVDYDKK